MKKLDRQGFTIVELLLLVVVAGIIVATGIYVVKAKQNSEASLKSDTSKVEKVTSKPVNVQGSSYEFKELGIKFIKPYDLSGLSYSVGEIDTSKGKALSAYLADSSLVELYNECALVAGNEQSAEALGFASITKFPGTYKREAMDVTDGSFVKQFTDFYVTYGIPNGAICGSSDDTLNDKWLAALKRSQDLFFESFKLTVKPTE
jgi:hypothetical protein